MGRSTDKNRRNRVRKQNNARKLRVAAKRGKKATAPAARPAA